MLNSSCILVLVVLEIAVLARQAPCHCVISQPFSVFTLKPQNSSEVGVIIKSHCTGEGAQLPVGKQLTP